VPAINQKYLTNIILAFGFIFLLSGIFFGLNIYDEGVVLVNAKHVLQGNLPYSDFWTMYAPGQFYMLAGWFSVFPETVISERILSVLILFSYAFVAYLISSKYSDQKNSIIAYIIILILIAAYTGFGRSLSTAMMLSLMGIFTFLRYYESKRIKYLVIAGLLAALTGIFRHDMGAYLLISLASTLLILKNRKQSKIKSLSILIASTLIATAILMSYFIINIPLETLYHSLIEAPNSIFREYRSLPYPIPFVVSDFSGQEISNFRKMILIWDSIIFYLPLAIYIFSSYRLIKQRKDESATQVARLILTIFGIILYNQTSVRADIEHLLPTLIVSITLLSTYIKLNNFNLVKKIIIATFVFSLVSVPLIKHLKSIRDIMIRKEMHYFENSKFEGVILDFGQTHDYQLIEAYLRDINPEEKVFVGLTRHDQIYVNDIFLYFLIDREIPTKYTELHPGVASSEAVQREIIHELEDNSVNYIILYEGEIVPEPNKSSQSSGVTLLDEYIKSNFDKVPNLYYLHPYQIFERKKPI
jgi:Dolichyl-phosphate-mannose-protein mannosyltransferase